MGIDAGAGYRLLEHTADAGLVAWGPDPWQAFSQAAWGMFEIVLGTDPRDLRESGRLVTLEVEVEGRTWDDLLVNWLAELVFHFDVDGFVPRQIAFTECAPPRCAAQLLGARLDDPEEAGGVGIKAVTYHQLSVAVAPGRTELQVIFDI
jgi:SHS2 domain-containing protein